MNVANIRAVGLGIIGGKMRQDAFVADGNTGFWIERSNEKAISGRFIEKHATEDVVTDPFGHELRFKHVYFAEQRFELRATSPNLILFDSSPVSKRLIGRLSDYSDFRFSISEIQCSIMELAKSLAEKFEKLEAYGISFPEFSITQEIGVKMSFRGCVDVRAEAMRFIGKHKVEPSALKLQFLFADDIRRCEIRPHGSVYIYGEDDPELTSAILRAIQDCSGRLN